MIASLISSFVAACLTLGLADQAKASAESKLDEKFAAIQAADTRVATIGYRINRANLDRCDQHAVMPGLLLQAADQFPIGVRQEAEQFFSLGAYVSVEAVVVGSPAAAAGLRPGDAILSVDGHRTMPTSLTLKSTRYDTVQAALDLIEAEATNHDVLTLLIVRDNRARDVSVPVTFGCAVRVQVVPSTDINAFADDRYASVTTALAQFATNENELALFLGHELAHAYLHHEALLDKAAASRRLRGRSGVPAPIVLETERQADQLGMLLAARAGYDMTHAADFWKRLAEARGGVSFGRSHPGISERIKAARVFARNLPPTTDRDTTPASSERTK